MAGFRFRAAGVAALAAAFVAAAGEGRLVVVGTNEVSLGTFRTTENRVTCVKIRNAGDGPLRIERIVMSCSCLRADSFPPSLCPHEEGVVSVSVRGSDLSGPFVRSFHIKSDDSRQPLATVRIKGVARPLFEVSCDKKTVLGPVEPGTVWTGRYELAASEAGLSLGEGTASCRGTRCDYAVATNRAAKTGYAVTARVSFLGEGLMESELSFPVLEGGATNGLPPVRLRVSAFGRRGLRVAPALVVLPDAGAAAARRFVVSDDPSGEPAGAGRFRCESDGGRVDVKARPMPGGRSFFVDMTFSESFVRSLEPSKTNVVRLWHGDRGPAEIGVVRQ